MAQTPTSPTAVGPVPPPAGISGPGAGSAEEEGEVQALQMGELGTRWPEGYSPAPFDFSHHRLYCQVSFTLQMI